MIIDKSDDGQDTLWTAHDIELSLWSYVTAKRFRPSILVEIGGTTTGPSDRREDRGPSDNDELSRPPLKKSKMT